MSSLASWQLGATNPSAEWTTLDQARIFPSPASLLHSFSGCGHKKTPKHVNNNKKAEYERKQYMENILLQSRLVQMN